MTDAFFEQLDEQLGPSRGPKGEPSATDFLIMDLPAAAERFATDFDCLPEITVGDGDGRVLITSGVLVRAFAVYGLLRPDETIDLIGVELDLA